MNAYSELLDEMEVGEEIEAIVFGDWGWGGYGETFDAIPSVVKYKILAPEDAAPYMEGWSFYGGYGSPDCYAVYVWTNKRVLWVTQYDGATGLDSAHRNPIDCKPDMPGG